MASRESQLAISPAPAVTTYEVSGVRGRTDEKGRGEGPTATGEDRIENLKKHVFTYQVRTSDLGCSDPSNISTFPTVPGSNVPSFQPGSVPSFQQFVVRSFVRSPSSSCGQ